MALYVLYVCEWYMPTHLHMYVHIVQYMFAFNTWCMILIEHQSVEALRAEEVFLCEGQEGSQMQFSRTHKTLCWQIHWYETSRQSFKLVKYYAVRCFTTNDLNCKQLISGVEKRTTLLQGMWNVSNLPTASHFCCLSRWPVLSVPCRYARLCTGHYSPEQLWMRNIYCMWMCTYMHTYTVWWIENITLPEDW